jgi:hypothetical protein
MKKGLLDRVLDIDRRIVMVGLIIILSIPLARPLGLPIQITEHPKRFYEIIENLKPGDKVLFNYIPPVVLMGDLVPQSIPVIYHLFKKQVKLYFVGMSVADGILNLLDSQVFAVIPPEKFGYKYGEDWVNLGFVAGGDISWATFAKDIRSAVQYDRYGNPIDSLPMMQGINKITDFDIILNCGEYNTVIVRQWGEPYKMPLLLICLAGAVVQDVEPFYRAGQVKEYLAGLGAGAEYERLVGRPGRAIASLDAISSSHLFLISLILLGNIAYISKKTRGGR